ncbi:hypothetical protein [Roseovarius albus]|uniref:hypothetical protein n=1 Tax=Roseovarius albus TaxID=1247867 RepID=UPI000A26A328|nr:hypothetical protein [Roseovarius albus]
MVVIAASVALGSEWTFEAFCQGTPANQNSNDYYADKAVFDLAGINDFFTRFLTTTVKNSECGTSQHSLPVKQTHVSAMRAPLPNRFVDLHTRVYFTSRTERDILTGREASGLFRA